MKVVELPATIVRLAGWVMIVGAKFTVSVAALLVALPTALVNTAWYRSPFNADVAATVNVVEVAPAMLEKLLPPLILTCH